MFVCFLSVNETCILNFLCAIRHTSLSTALLSFEECVWSLTHPHSRHAGQLGHLKSLPFLFFLSVATVTLRLAWKPQICGRLMILLFPFPECYFSPLSLSFSL